MMKIGKRRVRYQCSHPRTLCLSRLTSAHYLCLFLFQYETELGIGRYRCPWTNVSFL